jgi:hypothetical protein
MNNKTKKIIGDIIAFDDFVELNQINANISIIIF